MSKDDGSKAAAYEWGKQIAEEVIKNYRKIH